MASISFLQRRMGVGFSRAGKLIDLMDRDGLLGPQKGSKPREGFDPVQVAGEPERVKRKQRSAEGVLVDGTTWQEILDAAKKLGLDPARINAAAGI